MIEVTHRGYQIETSAVVLATGKWAAHAVVSWDEGRTDQTFPMAEGRNREFDTADEAHAEALQLAKAWIDHREGGA